MIEIPISVITPDGSVEPSRGGRASPADRCNDAIENCQLKDELGIDDKVRRAFTMLGISSWVRSILGLNPVAHLPTAVTYLIAKNGNQFKTFKWVVVWWNHIAGWVCTAAYIGIYWLLFQDAGYWWIAVDVIVIDTMGWFVYYAYRKDAIRYAHYLE